MEHQIIGLASGTDRGPASDHLRDWSSNSEYTVDFNHLVLLKSAPVFYKTAGHRKEKESCKPLRLFSQSGILLHVVYLKECILIIM